MSRAFRLCSARFPSNSGVGAALYGGRWNRVGTEVIYTAESPSLAALEVLVHYNVLPVDFAMTEIVIPHTVTILRIEAEHLPSGWDSETPGHATQELGDRWKREGQSAILSVPSSIVQAERNLVLNPAHPEFASVAFKKAVPFRFDLRLK